MAIQAINERKVDRPLSEEERSLLIWLVDNGDEEARSLKHEIERVTVETECGCGCASIDFAVDGKSLKVNSGMIVVSDHLYESENGNQMGCFLYSIEGHLAGIEVYSLDGEETPNVLPNPQKLYPFQN